VRASLARPRVGWRLSHLGQDCRPSVPNGAADAAEATCPVGPGRRSECAGGFVAKTSTELGAAPAEPHLFGEPDSAKDRALRWDPLLACGGGWRPPSGAASAGHGTRRRPRPRRRATRSWWQSWSLSLRAVTIHQEHANLRPAGLYGFPLVMISNSGRDGPGLSAEAVASSTEAP
jgi:hypothetical protein